MQIGADHPVCELRHIVFAEVNDQAIILAVQQFAVPIRRLLAELAGHSHISTTQQYIDVNAEQLANAVELL